MNQRSGRANQKARTRAAIVAAAKALHCGGGAPSLAEVADAAKVSRATAYRYFPTHEALRVELEAGNVNASIDELVARFSCEDARERLLALIDAYGELALREEAHMRTALRVYQDTWLRAREAGAAPRVRHGRRLGGSRRRSRRCRKCLWRR